MKSCRNTGLSWPLPLGVLIDKSLEKVNDDGQWMHDLQHEMGKNMVYQEFPRSLESVVDCGYIFVDINNVLTKNIVRGYLQYLSNLPFYMVQQTWNGFGNLKFCNSLILLFTIMNKSS